MHRSKKILGSLFFCLFSTFLMAQQQEKTPPPAASPEKTTQEIKLAPEEETALLVRWQDIEKAQLALQNIVLSIQVNHGWNKDYYYDFTQRKFLHAPTKVEKK